MMFITIIQVALMVAIAVIVYQAFIGDWVDDKLEASKIKKNKLNSVSKMAMIKMASDDPKDIENFISDNVEHLSDEQVQQFVGRIENLKADRFIASDDLLKKRIDDLQPAKEENESKGKNAKRAG